MPNFISANGYNVASGSTGGGTQLLGPAVCAIVFSTSTANGGANTNNPDTEVSMGMWANGSEQNCIASGCLNGVGGTATAWTKFHSNRIAAVPRPSAGSGQYWGETTVSQEPSGIGFQDATGSNAGTINHRTLQFGSDCVAQAVCQSGNLLASTGTFQLNLGFRPDCVFFMTGRTEDTIAAAMSTSFGACVSDKYNAGSIRARNRGLSSYFNQGSGHNGTAVRSTGTTIRTLNAAGVLGECAISMYDEGFEYNVTQADTGASVTWLAIRLQPNVSQRVASKNLNTGATSSDFTLLNTNTLGAIEMIMDMGPASSDNVSGTGMYCMTTMISDTNETGVGTALSNQQLGWAFLYDSVNTDCITHRGGGRRFYDRFKNLAQAAAITSTSTGHSWSGVTGSFGNSLLGICIGWSRAKPDPMPIQLGSQVAETIYFGGQHVREVWMGSTQLWDESS